MAGRGAAASCRGSSASTSRPGAWTAARKRRARATGSASSRRAARRCSSPPTTSSSPPRFAARVVLLGDGELIADGPADEILSGGWYFATEVARILGAGGAITPEAGRRTLLRVRLASGRGLRRADELAGSPSSPVLGARPRRRASPGTSARGRRARLVALVAALAALAVAGRLVLAPIPNVVATTDIALITGYALGAGARASRSARWRRRSRTSGSARARGPPWQMAGWGLVGLAGALARDASPAAGSAASASRPPARSPGFAYGALLDLSVMVTYGGEQSLDRYLALSARGIPFNVAHAARQLRDRARRRPGAGADDLALPRPGSSSPGARRGALPLVAARRCSPPARSPAAPPPADAARASRPSAGCVERRRTPTAASAPTPGQPSSPAMTGWAMLGLEAAGPQPARPPLAAARRRSPTCARRPAGCGSVGDLERTILALAGAGLDPRDFAGTDLVAELRVTPRRRRLGRRPGQPDRLLRPRDPRRRAPTPARWSARRAGCAGAQNADGGWGIQPAAPSEADSTGAALQGLVAAGLAGIGDRRRRRLAAQGPARRRRLGARHERRRQLAVDRLGGPGPGRRPAAGGEAIDRALAYLARLPERRRPLPLLGLQRPDPDLGHAQAAARGRAPAVPDPRGRAQLRALGLRGG